jgi:hypothetical protein
MKKELIEMDYEDIKKNLLRVELWLTPILLISPIIVSTIFIIDWFYRGFSVGIATYNGELFIGIMIIVGNALFNIPFLKSLIKLSRK